MKPGCFVFSQFCNNENTKRDFIHSNHIDWFLFFISCYIIIFVFTFSIILQDNSEEMYSLDNDSFLNSLEAMTIQNYWTDTVKHTKL